MIIRHERNIDFFICARIEQFRLPTTVLLSRCSKQLDPTTNIIFLLQMSQRQESGYTGRCNKVVATRVSNAWKSVIFCIEVDKPSLSSANTLEGGIETIGVSGNREALCFEKVAD